MNRKLIQQLKNNKNIVAAYLFGSYGTKKQTPLSDIDLCLFTKKTDKKTILDLYSYGSEKMDISIFDNLPIYIKPEVFRGKPLFVKDKKLVAEKFAFSFRQYQDFKKYEQKYWNSLKERFSHEKK